MKKPTFRITLAVSLTLLSALLLAGCDLVDNIPDLFASTSIPAPTPGPTRTPQPGNPLAVTVRVPANTPPGNTVQLVLPDFVAGGARTIAMTPGADFSYTTSLTMPQGAFVQYRYELVSETQIIPETTRVGDAITYRVFHDSAGNNINDTVARWHSLPPAGGAVALTGFVRDSLTGAPIAGVMVSAGGQQVLSGHAGGYVIRNLSPGSHTVTAFVPDGRWRIASQSVVVPQGTAQVDVGMLAARAVQVTFLATPPAGMPDNATFYLAGNVRQLGDTLRVQPGGSTIVANRQQLLSWLEDGRLSATLSLFEGQQLNYRYTLGDGRLNGELDSNGTALVRSFVVPGFDVTLQEQIGAVQGELPPVTFTVAVTGDTPRDDGVSLQLHIDGEWQAPLPMWPVPNNTYTYVLYNPLDTAVEMGYRFCRNSACDASPDVAQAGEAATGDRFTPALEPQTLQQRVDAWQWWAQPPNYDLTVPQVAARPQLLLGIGLAETWQPSAQPRIAATFDGLRVLHADTVRIPVVWELTANGEIRPNPAQSILAEDLIEQIRAAHDRGLRVALYPLVRPAPDGPYAGNAQVFWTIQAPTADGNWWALWFDSYRRFLLTQAQLAEFHGVEYLYVGEPGLGAALPGEPFAAPEAEGRWRTLLDEVRQVYLRPIVFQVRLGGRPPVFRPLPPAFVDSVDVLDVQWQVGLSDSDSPARADMQAVALATLDAQVAPLARDERQIWLSLRYPSVNRGATQCVTLNSNECLPLTRFDPGEPFDTLLPIDLTEQASAYDAMLNAINARAWVRGVFSDGYYVPLALRDLSISVRSKPAESVLAAWFLAWGVGE